MAGWRRCGPYRCAGHLLAAPRDRSPGWLVIGVMSVTGVLLAFERQIVAFAERDVRTVQPPASGCHASRSMTW